jgi:hypothetical protein
MGPDFRSGPQALRLLNDRRWGKIFDEGFHRDRRGGTVPLAMLAAFLAAKIALVMLVRECSPLVFFEMAGPAAQPVSLRRRSLCKWFCQP